jgi:hypothetical protein
MQTVHSNARLAVVVGRAGICAAGVLLLSCSRSGEPAMAQIASARELVGDLRTGLAQSIQATDRAVLAETDEASEAFAREAREISGRVEVRRDQAAALLQKLGFDDEARGLQDFATKWSELRKVGEETLKLAVENTNLKARRLSFGPVAEAADAFEAALEAGVLHAAGRGDPAARLRAARAELAVRKVQILQGPHIAEPDDGAMSKLEAQMTALEKEAMDGLKALEPSLGPAAAATARGALDRFLAESSHLIMLSRRNTNVISLSLAMSRLPPLTSACNAALEAVAQALDRRGFTGTR